VRKRAECIKLQQTQTTRHSDPLRHWAGLTARNGSTRYRAVHPPEPDMVTQPTACLALADGTVFFGRGFGATGQTVAELCFNTAMTGYQEIMTDPSYAGQVVTFTFPHIGNVGVNPEDDETADPVAAGMVVKRDPTVPSNRRSTEALGKWQGRPGRSGIGGRARARSRAFIASSGASVPSWTVPKNVSRGTSRDP